MDQDGEGAGETADEFATTPASGISMGFGAPFVDICAVVVLADGCTPGRMSIDIDGHGTGTQLAVANCPFAWPFA